jgi:hypothetical protein
LDAWQLACVAEKILTCVGLFLMVTLTRSTDAGRRWDGRTHGGMTCEEKA